MSDAFALFKPENIVITAVSPWLAERARQSAILKRFSVKYVPNGVNTGIFKLSAPITFDCFGKSAPTVLFVTPFFSLKPGNLKGGHLLPLIADRLPEYNFLVVASQTSDIDTSILPSNLKIWGRAKDQQELARLYSSADLTLLLSRRETFSMVTAESLCCGTPVVGFKAGGPESIAIPDYSAFVNQGDIDSLIIEIKKMISNQDVNSFSVANASAIAYAENTMSEKFLNVYKSI